jgi:SAM-dependent methyltransferase
MREVTEKEYKDFLATHKEVVIEGTAVKLVQWGQLKLFEPKEFTLEKTTVWSFENRGKWATHRGNYRANWAPEIPRNLVIRYTNPGDLVLDQMVGSGTTLVECKLLGRNSIGVDINLDALMLAWNRLDFKYANTDSSQKLYLGDARNLDLIPNESIDLIATHPPYANIVSFTKSKKVEGDLSRVHSIDEFISGMNDVARESLRVLKPGKHCAILIGDTHRHKHFVPISYRVLEAFLNAEYAGTRFILREDVIKRQWHTQTMRGRWKEKYEHDFLLTFHEHLFIFRKPSEGEDISKFKDSMMWK